MSKEKKTAAQPKRNAADTIKALENLLMNQNEQINVLADEIDRLRQLVTALGKRLNASIQAAEDGQLTGDSVNKIILQENVKELEGKIKYLIEQGVLKKNNDAPITDKTFVVGRTVDAEGNVVDPRVQFAVGSIDKEVQGKLLNKKAGELVSYEDGEPNFEITEVYEIHQPNVKKNFEAQPSNSQFLITNMIRRVHD